MQGWSDAITVVAMLSSSRVGLTARVGLAAAATTAAVYAARRFLRRASTLSIDPALFSADAIDAETREASEKAMAAAATMTPSYEIGPVAQRERRRAQYMAEHVAHFGNAKKPAQREDRKVSHESSSSPVGVSIFRPSSASNALRGVYLHIHGGGWYLGESAWQNDIRMCGLADRLSIAIVSVDYSLAPEHVWPRPYNDCIAAASWLVNNAQAEFGTDTLIIGGESAGGQLCALTCLGLRKALKLPSTAPFPYKAANLVYGCYDMGGTPSLHNYHKPLVFNWEEFEWCSKLVIPDHFDRRDPSVSPLYCKSEELATMPPALFTCGTDDALIDDTLFLASRWHAAGAHAELSLMPGGAHGVGHFGPHARTALGKKCHQRIEDWMQQWL